MNRLLKCPCWRRVSLLLLVVLAFPAFPETVPFRRAMELAASHLGATPVAADQVRAHAAYQEARNMFLPQIVVGSGLGKSFGFPVTIEGAAPSLFDINYQSFLFNPAQREFIRSAHAEWNAASAGTEDQRNALLLEAALSYVQLDAINARIQGLRQQEEQAARLEDVIRARAGAGFNSQMDVTRARLQTARVRMRVADAQGVADVLRERLSQLTGLPADSIQTVTESIPQIPDVSQEQNLLPTALSASPALKMVESEADAKELRAKGEHKALYPAVDAVAQYGVFTKYNNYDQYFLRFQRNNATVGVSIRFPFLNFAQRAHAEAADADALKAKRQAEDTRNQLSTDTLKLARSVQQLSAAQEVAMLERELAQGQVEAVRARLEERAPAPGPGETPQPPTTPADLQQALIDASERYGGYLDATFELDKARMQLLRATGQLQSWALGTP